ncbi:MAG TPA: thioredoxin family protein [Saprospiraceae bacterium]|nr:thioredoxin family protein [Saprospiraceae bacterium]
MLNFIISFCLFFGLSFDGLKPGDIAPDFNLKNVNGKTVSLNQFEDAKGFVVVFTCNHCPYAKLYEDRIIALAKKYRSKNIEVIAINPNDPEVVPEDGFKQMKQLAKKKKYPFPYLLDDGQKVYPQYGATKTPHVFVLNADRRVVYIGAIDDNAKHSEEVKKKYVEDAIESILNGTEPEVKEAKAIGCSIKTKKS